MPDRMTIEQRHNNMAAIKGKDTKPEILVRKFLWARGFRYSQILLNVREVLVLNCKRVNDHAAMNDCIDMVILINILKKRTSTMWLKIFF